MIKKKKDKYNMLKETKSERSRKFGNAGSNFGT